MGVMRVPRGLGKSQMVERIMAQRLQRIYTPWTYLEQLVRSDRAPEHNEEWMTKKLQEQWPGPYKVRYNGWSVYPGKYEIVFDTPADETWARLQWTY